MKIITEPQVYLIGRPNLDIPETHAALRDMGFRPNDSFPAPDGEEIVELAGRTCYQSYEGGRPHDEYILNILESGHGSVLEAANWSFLIIGISRSLTHELIRHRAGFGYSQLSQRYVDETTANFVEPDIIADDPLAHSLWQNGIHAAHAAYKNLVGRLSTIVESKHPDISKTERRKMARQAARSVLPNATETKIFVTANARAIRHFIEMRGSIHAEIEIRKLAVQLCRIMKQEAPNIFNDYEFVTLADGTLGVEGKYRKV